MRTKVKVRKTGGTWTWTVIRHPWGFLDDLIVAFVGTTVATGVGEGQQDAMLSGLTVKRLLDGIEP